MFGIGAKEVRTALRSSPDRVPPFKNIVWGGSGISIAASTMLLGWLSLYATDTLGLSPVVIGFVIAGSQVVNAIGSLVAAYVVDRSPVTRWGKARPYEIAVPLVWVATIALFATPVSFDPVARTIWIAVMFILIQGVFDPFLRANDTLYMVRSFATRGQWTKVVTTSGFVIMVGIIPFAVLVPVLLDSAGKDPGQWTLTVVGIAIVMTVIGLTRFFLVKEKYGTADDAEPPVKVRQMVHAVRQNRWIWFFSTVPFIVSASTSANVTGYYFRYVVGDLSVQGVLGAISIVVLPVMLLLPKLIARFAVSRVIMAFALLGVVGNTICAFAWGSVPVIVIGSVLAGIGSLPAAFLTAIMILDLCAYNEWKGNRRLESTIGALTGIFSRLGVALAAGTAGVVLSVAGYDGTLDVQSEGAQQAINALAFWLPAALALALAILMYLYGRFDVGLMPIVREDLRARHEEQGEAIDPIDGGVQA